MLISNLALRSLFGDLILLSTTSWIKLIDKKKFAKAALDENSETFVIYVVALEAETLVYPLQTAQIAALQLDKTPTKILAE